MKDIYSPIEIDEQWDQRAPMMEGDAIDDAMTHWAADKEGSGGATAVMDPPAPPTTTEWNGVNDPEIATDTVVHEPSEDTDIQMHADDSMSGSENTIAAETITPVVEVHPDHPRPTPTEKFGADTEDNSETDETRPASDEAVKDLDHAVAELPHPEHRKLGDDELFDADHKVEHVAEESRTVRQAHEAASALTKQIEAGIKDLSKKLETKNAELRDLEAQKAALEDLGSHALLQNDEFEAA